MTQSIAEALYREADLARHQELLDFAFELYREHKDNAPRIDTGEWTINAQSRIDDLRDHLNIDNPHPLRRVRLECNSRGAWCAILDAIPRPFPWEEAAPNLDHEGAP